MKIKKRPDMDKAAQGGMAADFWSEEDERHAAICDQVKHNGHIAPGPTKPHPLNPDGTEQGNAPEDQTTENESSVIEIKPGDVFMVGNKRFFATGDGSVLEVVD